MAPVSTENAPKTKDLIETEKAMTVVKRSGVIVPFNQTRIAKAIEAAVRDVENIERSEALESKHQIMVQKVTSAVVKELQEKSNQGHSLSVEGIQDVVEEKLMDQGHHNVAKSYIIYRDKHSQLRKNQVEFPSVLRSDHKTVVRFNPIKIGSKLEHAFRKTFQIEGPLPEDIFETINELTETIIKNIVEQNLQEPISTHEIAEEVENELMAWGYFKVAKFLILEHGNAVKKELDLSSLEPVKGEVTKKAFNVDTFLKDVFTFATQGFDVDPKKLITRAKNLTFEGITQKETYAAAILAVKEHIELDPEYAFIASKVLLDAIYRETLDKPAVYSKLEKVQRDYFVSYMKMAGSKDSRLGPKLKEFDLEKLALALDLKRDSKFSYLGLQTLYDRYFIHKDQKRLETPQIFWMRVAMGLAINEGELKNEKAIEFYDNLSTFHALSSTPTLFNAGTKHSQLSSCYLSTVEDDLHSIFKVIADDAQLSKWAGGLGNDWTPIRTTGSGIKGTNGQSQGVIPFLKIVNDTAVAVNQGGKRKGAACVYLETWHLDIEDFIELRKNTGDERRRTHDINTANWIPDLFMKRVQQEGKWTLFSPLDTPDLHDLYGDAFEEKYAEYEKMAEEGKIKLSKTVDALTLWRKMLSMLFETGHPWITFKDPSNLRSPQDHAGVVHSSNLCTEILLNTSSSETAVCNLASINLATHMSEQGLDYEKLKKTILTTVRMLDNVIDINFYPIKEAENSNKKHRPIGLGIMGFQDCLYKLNISYASHQAVEFADKSMEFISYYAILASSNLAKEKGRYESYKGSKWDRGILPIDSLKAFVEYRKENIDVDTSSTMDWDTLRKTVQTQGMRNSNTMAIAPTATIANICNVTACIEPTYKHLFVKSNLSGEFTVINPYLVTHLKALDIWDQEMVDDLKYFDGSLAEIERIPDEIKKVFLTAFEIEPEWIIECASRRQKWIDMGQSLNLFLSAPSGKKIHNMYMLAWKKGLKTQYYLRTLGATQIEKSSTDINKRGLQPRWMKNASASSKIKVNRSSNKPTVCSLEEGCESCQ